MYTEEQQQELWRAYLRWRARSVDLVMEFVRRAYRSPQGREHGMHGVARRIGTLRDCLGNVLESVPVNAELPTRDDLTDPQKTALRWDKQPEYLKNSQLYPVADAYMDAAMQDVWTEMLQQ